MFKLTGCVLIVVSAIYIISEKTLKAYFTYVYLNEIVSILQLLKQACKMGRTYSFVINSLDKEKYRLVFSDIQEYITDKKQTDCTKNLLSELGKRNKSEEVEYIQCVIDQTEKSASEYKAYVDNNKKSVFLSGVSLGLVITIILI